MKKILAIALMSVLSYSAFSQKDASESVTPIVDIKLRGLLGGVKNGKWIKDFETAKWMEKNDNFKILKASGAEDGDIATGNVMMPDVPCDEFYGVTLDFERDFGVAVGVGATWNFSPRAIKQLDVDSKVYKEVVKKYLAKNGLSRSMIKIDQLFLVDLDGDSVDEVLISASYYKNGVSPSAKAGEYSFVMLRKITGKTVTEIILAEDLIKKNIEFGAPYKYQISTIADLNGDGKMEVVVFGEYYEGAFSSVYEINGIKKTEVLTSGCGV